MKAIAVLLLTAAVVTVAPPASWIATTGCVAPGSHTHTKASR